MKTTQFTIKYQITNIFKKLLTFNNGISAQFTKTVKFYVKIYEIIFIKKC